MPELSTVEIVTRLVIVALLCGAIGYEREYRHKPAGFRTMMLVGIGTATMTMVGLEVARMAGTMAAGDVSRIMSTILTGIGFIGAGTIIQSGGEVNGLTTAATIWVVAGIGMCTGLGLFPMAVATTVLALLVLITLRFVRFTEAEKQANKKSDR